MELIDRLLKQYKVLFESGKLVTAGHLDCSDKFPRCYIKNAMLLPASQASSQALLNFCTTQEHQKVFLQTDIAMPDDNKLSQCIGNDMARISSVEALPFDVDRDNENFTHDAFDPRAVTSQNYLTIDPL